MAKYILKSSSGVNSERERELDDFSREKFEAYENDKLSDFERSELQQQAEEDQYFEWWIEEIEG